MICASSWNSKRPNHQTIGENVALCRLRLPWQSGCGPRAHARDLRTGAARGVPEKEKTPRFHVRFLVRPQELESWAL